MKTIKILFALTILTNISCSSDDNDCRCRTFKQPGSDDLEYTIFACSDNEEWRDHEAYREAIERCR